MGEGRFEKCRRCTPQTGRKPGCHATCEHYAKARIKHQGDVERIRRARDAEILADNTAVKLTFERRKRYAK